MGNLNDLVAEYGKLKDLEKTYKKPISEANNGIKQLIMQEGTKIQTADGTVKYEARGGGYIATYSVSVSENFDEEKLIDKLQHMVYTPEGGAFANVIVASGLGIVKMKPYVDMNALEDAIYKGYIKAEDLNSCIIKTETPKLNIKKEK